MPPSGLVCVRLSPQTLCMAVVEGSRPNRHAAVRVMWCVAKVCSEAIFFYPNVESDLHHLHGSGWASSLRLLSMWVCAFGIFVVGCSL